MDTPTTSSQKMGAAFLLGIVLLAVSAFFRLLTYPVITSDYTYFLAKWFVELQKHPGLTAFLYPFSDYAPLYLYFIKLLTFIPVYSLWSIKTLSLVFDLYLAFMASKIVSDKTTWSREKAFLAFAIMFSVPTVAINSSLWGQSDAAYSACILASIYYIIKNRPRLATIAFGVGLCFKLQAIFFIPVLAGILINQKALKELVWIPIVYMVSLIPALIGGASFMQTFFIYAHQSGEYKHLNLSSPSVYAFVEKMGIPAASEPIYFWTGIVLSALVAVVAFLVATRLPKRVDALIFVSLWCVLLIPYFLPRMHERYFFLADVLAVLLAIFRPKSIPVAVLVVGGSLLSYIPYLSGQMSILSSVQVDLRYPSAMLFTAALLLTIYAVRFTVQEIQAKRKAIAQ